MSMQRPHSSPLPTGDGARLRDSPLPTGEGARGRGTLIAACLALVIGTLQADEQVTPPPQQEPQSYPADPAPQATGFSWSRNDSVWPADAGAQEAIAAEAWVAPAAPDVAASDAVPRGVAQPGQTTRPDAGNDQETIASGEGEN